MENDELKSYLEEALKIFKKNCDDRIVEFKKDLQFSHNQFLLKKIEEAEGNMKKSRDSFIKIFEDGMSALRERRERGHPMMKKSFDMWEDSLKKQLESNLKFVQNNWGDYIESCKSQIR